MLVMASLWYLAMTSVLMVGQYYIERYYARGSVRRCHRRRCSACGAADPSRSCDERGRRRRSGAAQD